MLRDVRNYTFNHSVDSLSPEHAVGDPPVLELLEQVRQITDRDLGVSSAGPSPVDGAPETSGGTPERWKRMKRNDLLTHIMYLLLN